MAKKKKAPEQKRPDNVADIVWKEIEYTCPVRGLVKQKVKVVVYKSVQNVQTALVKTGNPLIDNSFDLEEIPLLDDEEPKQEK